LFGSPDKNITAPPDRDCIVLDQSQQLKPLNDGTQDTISIVFGNCLFVKVLPLAEDDTQRR
jgi:hypothetical protein